MAAWESGESGHAHPKGLLPNGNSYLPDAPEAIKHVKFGGRLLIVGELIAEPLPVHLQSVWVGLSMYVAMREAYPSACGTHIPTHISPSPCAH
jgi:hypothetical protein